MPVVLWETGGLTEVCLERSRKACEQGTGAPGEFHNVAGAVCGDNTLEGDTNDLTTHNDS